MATCTYNFYPRSPCGERPATPRAGRQAAAISIHALLAESDVVHVTEHASPGRISIHALLAESDITDNSNRHSELNFYPRSPCGERLVTKMTNFRAPIFLSTLSLRRATCRWHSLRHNARDFYPRSPCGERPAERAANGDIHHFYPRSPCGERRVALVAPGQTGVFLSTLSLRRATVDVVNVNFLCADFYPRSPCGERLLCRNYSIAQALFLSTLSLRRATCVN